MPKSKRAKVVPTSRTTKKGKQLTLTLHANIRAAIPKYPYLYIFRVDNMRNTYLKDVRTKLTDSRLFFGKTRTMASALGPTAALSPSPGLHLLSPHLHGNIGLLFSTSPPAEILSFFASFTPADYARAGTIASRTFTLPSGTLYSRGGEVDHEADVLVSVQQEPGLRRLGVPTRVVKGRVVVEGGEGGEGWTVCREGEVLGSGQSGLLKMFGVQMAVFRVAVVAYWVRDTGAVEVVEGEEKEAEAEAMEVEVEG